MAVGLALTSLAFFGAWGVLRYWSKTVEVQLEVDRCVGQSALWAKTTLNEIETTNKAIEATRASLVVASILPPAEAALRAALEAAVVLQEGLRFSWQARSFEWKLGLGCPGYLALLPNFPELPYYRPPPDLVGSQALEWPIGQSKDLHFEMTVQNSFISRKGMAHPSLAFLKISRTAAAEVSSESDPSPLKNLNPLWKANWAPPRSRLLRASIR
jgi:hypothetical protein